MNGRSVSEYQQDEGDSSKLIILRLHRNMAGEVKCRVYNDYGAEFSNAAQITVIGKKCASTKKTNKGQLMDILTFSYYMVVHLPKMISSR